MGLSERVEDKDHLEHPQTPKRTQKAPKKGVCEENAE